VGCIATVTHHTLFRHTDAHFARVGRMEGRIMGLVPCREAECCFRVTSKGTIGVFLYGTFFAGLCAENNVYCILVESVGWFGEPHEHYICSGEGSSNTRLGSSQFNVDCDLSFRGQGKCVSSVSPTFSPAPE